MERPFRQILGIFNENIPKDKELLKFVFEKSDSISLWIIGLSIGAISIIANDIGKIKGAIPHPYLSTIMYLLVISVITGILYRMSCLYFFVINNHISKNLEIAFSGKESMDTESFLIGNESYEQLLKIVKRAFDDDNDYLIPLYEQADEEGRKKLYDSMVKHYLSNVKWAKKDKDNALDFVIETYASYTGISKEKYKRKAEFRKKV
jgi:hypothetical protein